MNNQTPSILVVDDNAAHRTLIKRAFSKGGFTQEILEAGSIAAAHALLDSNQTQPTIFVIDLNLSDGRGTELARAIRAKEVLQQTPIIILSTSNLEQDRLDSTKAGASHFVVKDKDVGKFTEQIVQIVRETIAQHS